MASARSTRSTRGPIALALALFLLVCQVRGGSPLDARPKPEPGRLAARCHPLITRRVVTCSLYLVFKEPTVGRPRAATVRFPACCTNRHGSRPFLGEPSKVTTEIFACQSPWNFVWGSLPRGGKKKAPRGTRSNNRLPRRTPPTETTCPIFNTRARGGNRSPSMSRRQRLLAEQALSSTEPRARYLTNPTAAYLAYLAAISVARSIHNTGYPPNGQGTRHYS